MPADIPPPVDLSACAKEPIHAPGAVQGHGVLAVLDGAGTILTVSANAADLLGLSPGDVTGRHAGLLLGSDGPDGPGNLSITYGHGTAAHIAHLPRNDRGGWVTLIPWRDRLILEVEPDDPAAPCIDDVPDPAVLDQETNLFKLAQRAAELTRDAAGYDRVMVYRFHPDWTGEVIAEVRKPTATPYLGLRYPASDIPEQARALYLAGRVRVIADVNGIMSPLVPRLDPASGESWDIGVSQLRAMSPIHIEYLRNMGVAATLTASITVDGRLWGLIACHHDSRRLAAPPLRDAVGRIAERLAARIAWITHREAVRAEKVARDRADRLMRTLQDRENMAAALLFGGAGLRGTLRADGCALVVGDAILSAGRVPDTAWVRRIVGEAAERAVDGVYATDAVGRDLCAGTDVPPESCGVLALILGRMPLLAVVAFTGELVREVTWGGDPDKPAILDPATKRLSPRKSFELWRQTVRGTARPWAAEDAGLMRRLGDTLAATFPAAALHDRLLADIGELSRNGRRRFELAEELLDAVGEGIVTLVDQTDGGPVPVLTANRRFRETFGLDPEDLDGTTLPALLDRCGLPGTVADADGPDSVDCEAWTLNGGRRTFRLVRHVVADFRTPQDQARIVMIGLTDITEFSRVEEALRAARDQALEAERVKSSFLAGVSHELRTPLNAIIGFSEMLDAAPFGPLGSERYTGYARDIHSAGHHLLTLVNDIVEMARLGSGAPILNEMRIDLAQEIHGAWELLRGQAESADLSYRFDPPGDDEVRVQADARGMRQAALNLLANAIKYTPAGGNVVCRVGRDEGGECWFEVADTGIGIADCDLPRLFQPFQRAGDQHVTGKPGSGLGLSLVKAIAELHGGRISINTRYGHGTTVRVSLPDWCRT